MNQQTHLARYRQVTEFLNELTAKKGADYAGPDNPFQNFTLIEIITSGKISTSAGLLVRLTDKLQRFANLLSRPPQVVGEAIDDTLLDLAGYAILAYLWLNVAKNELAFPGAAPVVETPEEDLANAKEVADFNPPEASTNTEDDAYRLLAAKVENGETLTIIERVQLISLAKAKLGID